MIVKILRCN